MTLSIKTTRGGMRSPERPADLLNRRRRRAGQVREIDLWPVLLLQHWESKGKKTTMIMREDYYCDFNRFTLVIVLHLAYKYIYQLCQVDSGCYCVMAAIFDDPSIYNACTLSKPRLKIGLSSICKFCFKVLSCTLELRSWMLFC